MRCYNHRDKDAIGVCKNCGRGLCVQCAREVDGSVVCTRDQCKEGVAALSELLSGANADVGKALTFPAVILYLLFGIVFIVGGFRYPAMKLLLVATGGIFLIGAIANFVGTRRLAVR
jgi:hypothetical protein